MAKRKKENRNKNHTVEVIVLVAAILDLLSAIIDLLGKLVD